MRFPHYLMVAALMLAALFGLEIWGGVSDGVLTQAQGECTVTVQLGESIQAAIDQAAEGDVICLAEGTWEENLKIEKSLTLRGVDAEETVIDGVEEGYPVVWIQRPEEAQTVSVKVEGLKVTGAKGECVDWPICPHGVLIRGKAQADISQSTISGNRGDGIRLLGSAQATISQSTISGNWYGIDLGDSAQATIEGNLIQGNTSYGIISSSSGEVRGGGNKMHDNGVDLGGNLPGTLREPLVEATEEEILYPDAEGRYPTLQHAVDALLPGGKLILRGEHAAGVTITKELTIVAQEGAEVTLVARGLGPAVLSLVGGARLTAVGLRLIGGFHGLLLGADAQADISKSTISESVHGILLCDSAQATVSKSTISENVHGILLEDSAQATIEGNLILSNEDYGVVLFERPCFDTDRVFRGYVTGKQNTIPGPDEPDGNKKDAVCPEELDFLMTEEGGEYHG